MSVKLEIPGKPILEAIADDNGVSVAVVDRSGIELFAFNNNSICKLLNPDGELVRECAAYCGLALAESTELAAHAGFTCHAGLECRASAMVLDGKPVAVIVGRTFVKADEYRRATQRVIDGDWQRFDPSEVFANVLLTSSADHLTDTLEQIEAEGTAIEDEDLTPPSNGVADVIATAAETASDELNAEIVRIAAEINRDPAEPLVETSAAGAPAIEVDELRTFFSSIFNHDYAEACEDFLELVARHYHLDSLVWLERKDRRLTKVAALGPLKAKRLNLGIPPDDARLFNAAKTELPVELSERPDGSDNLTRKMFLFPVPVGDDVPCVLAVLDPVENLSVNRQIARLCQTIGPQLEILRLRNEVTRKEAFSVAVRRFSDGLKNVDSDDFWLTMTKKIAEELMHAERGSLLVLNESTGLLEIKAAIGMKTAVALDVAPGSRVARRILERGKPAVVSDVAKTGLPPIPAERGYKTASFLSSPISLGGRNIAVINFTDKTSGAAFGRADLELLEEITPQIAVAIDRAILKEKVGEFAQLSVTDALTGLLNRRYIEERLIEEVKRSNRHGYPMSFIMLDVDYFKAYNDNYGHPAGDDALRIVSGVLRDTLRGADVAARYGGEEFAILLPQTRSDEAAAIAERLRANVESTIFPCRKVTVSIGVASCSSELCTTKGLVKAADLALYQAKDAGRNLVRVYGELETETQEI